MSAIAEIAGIRTTDVYRLMRLPGAPAPVTFVARVRVYRTAEALEYLGAQPPPKHEV